MIISKSQVETLVKDSMGYALETQATEDEKSEQKMSVLRVNGKERDKTNELVKQIGQRHWPPFGHKYGE